MTAPKKFSVSQLTEFTSTLFKATGMDAEKADCVARLLILTDMMGRRTHGLAISPLYLADIKSGGLQTRGEPKVLRD